MGRFSELMYGSTSGATAEAADPSHATNHVTGKPVFLAASTSQYQVTERDDLSTHERLALRERLMSKTQSAIQRRDTVYKALSSEYYTGGSVTKTVLGTPYPVIEPFPHVIECYKSIRWYEVGASFAAGFGTFAWIRSKPEWRHRRVVRGMTFFAPMMLTGLTLTGCGAIAEQRLMGLRENEYECDKYGIYDTKENLARKAANWARFATYKEEWMRRYNFFMYGERPEESATWLSTTVFKHFAVRYNTRLDYPARKNPMWLSAVPLREAHAEMAFVYELPRFSTITGTAADAEPYSAGRPELRERYQGVTIQNANAATVSSSV